MKKRLVYVGYRVFACRRGKCCSHVEDKVRTDVEVKGGEDINGALAVAADTVRAGQCLA